MQHTLPWCRNRNPRHAKFLRLLIGARLESFCPHSIKMLSPETHDLILGSVFTLVPSTEFRGSTPAPPELPLESEQYSQWIAHFKSDPTVSITTYFRQPAYQRAFASMGTRITERRWNNWASMLVRWNDHSACLRIYSFLESDHTLCLQESLTAFAQKNSQMY